MPDPSAIPPFDELDTVDTTDTELRRIMTNSYTAYDKTHRALAADLLAARARITDLEAERPRFSQRQFMQAHRDRDEAQSRAVTAEEDLVAARARITELETPPADVRAAAIERVAEAEYRWWWKLAAEEAPEWATAEPGWRKPFIERATRAVDAIADLLRPAPRAKATDE